MKLDISLCQFDMAWKQPSRNLAALAPLVASAAGDVVVLPEMFATGFVTDAEQVAETMDGPVVAAMRRWAADCGKAIAGSVAIREGDTFRNRMMFVEPSGRIAWADKRHLFAPGGENRDYTRGERRTVVEYRGVRFLLLLCYDLRFPVWSRCRGDYDAIIYAASWDMRRRDAWQTLLRARAVENQCYVIGVNRTGADPAASYAGDSAVIDFAGRTLADAGDRECVVTATIDMSARAAFVERFPTWRDADDFGIKADL